MNSATTRSTFRYQQADVMDAVQRMRAMAQRNGNCKTTPQQTVQTQTVEGGEQAIVLSRMVGVENVQMNTSDASSPFVFIEGVPSSVGRADLFQKHVELRDLHSFPPQRSSA